MKVVELSIHFTFTANNSLNSIISWQLLENISGIFVDIICYSHPLLDDHLLSTWVFPVRMSSLEIHYCQLASHCFYIKVRDQINKCKLTFAFANVL